MKDIKVIFELYRDMQPRTTLVNGQEPSPILIDNDGKEYFEAKAGMILTVSEDRAKYLVEDRKLAEYMKDADITLDSNDIKDIKATDNIPEGTDVVDGVVITEDNNKQEDDNNAQDNANEDDNNDDDNQDNKDNDNQDNDDDNQDDDKKDLDNKNELETADKTMDNLETADKKIVKKGNKK